MVESDTNQGVSHEETAIERAAAFDGDDSATQFSGEIHGDTVEVALRHLEGVVDEARFRFTPHGLYAAAVEEDNVAMNRTFVPAGEWDDYSLENGGVDGFSVDALGKTLRGLKTRKRDSDRLRFEVDENAGSETVFTVTDTEATSEDIPVMPAGSVRTTPTVPTLNFDADVTVADANVVREWVKSLPTSGVVSLTASTGARGSENSLTFEHKENVSESKNPADAEYVLEDVLVVDELDAVDVTARGHDYADEIGGDAVDAHAGNPDRVRGTYSTEYLKLWAKRLRKTRTENVPYALRFGEEWPLEVTREDGSTIVSEFLLAPRITVA